MTSCISWRRHFLSDVVISGLQRLGHVGLPTACNAMAVVSDLDRFWQRGVDRRIVSTEYGFGPSDIDGTASNPANRGSGTKTSRCVAALVFSEPAPLSGRRRRTTDQRLRRPEHGPADLSQRPAVINLLPSPLI